MKKFLYSILLFALFLIPTQSASLIWDLPTDTNGIVKYNLYVKTNSVTATNFYKLGSVNHPSNIFAFSLPKGENYTFYAASEDNMFIESEPSNLANYFEPVGIPPANSPLLTIESYNIATKVWGNAKLTWSYVDKSKYGFTNYFVKIEYDGITNQYLTPNNNYTFASLPLNAYRFSVISTNSLGSSPIIYYYLSDKNPRTVANLIIK